jgi:hypothetical protein
MDIPSRPSNSHDLHTSKPCSQNKQSLISTASQPEGTKGGHGQVAYWTYRWRWYCMSAMLRGHYET